VGVVVVVVVVDFDSGAGAGAGVSVVVVVLLVVVVAGSAGGGDAGDAGVMLVVLCEQPTMATAPAKIRATRLVVFIMRGVFRNRSSVSTIGTEPMRHS
jgi:hypothetical protein